MKAAAGNIAAIDIKSVEKYFRGVYDDCRVSDIKRLGSGVHGTGFLASITTPEGTKKFVFKSISPDGLGHDYPSDRASVLLLACDDYNLLPRHVKAIDVLSVGKDGALKSIGGGADYILVMERGEGTDYFSDLDAMSKKKRLDEEDREKISAMAEYLSNIHSVKKESRTLYLRKLRDIIGHGECLMGVFDAYPEGALSYKEMAEIEKLSIDWRAKLKEKWRRLSQIHGDFHPGNIWWKEKPGDEKTESIISRLCLLDRSRGPWGEPADDVTALAINYVFYSIRHFNAIAGPYLEGFRLFFDEYIKRTGDDEILRVLAPFFAFRGAVVANPVFYPELTPPQRRMIFNFVLNVLKAEKFDPETVEILALKSPLAS